MLIIDNVEILGIGIFISRRMIVIRQGEKSPLPGE